MPTDACQYFYDCKGCGAVLKPNAGDCCVFCSYGDVPCPPIQEARSPGRTLLRRGWLNRATHVLNRERRTGLATGGLLDCCGVSRVAP
jgi:hypothetical protein